MTIDLLAGVDLTGAHVLTSRRDYPEYGVLKGDRLVVRQQEAADAGALVVALVGEKATLTRFDPEGEASVLGVVSFVFGERN